MCCLLAHMSTFIIFVKKVTFVTLSKVPTLYLQWHGSKYIDFHENSLLMNLSQARSASLLPRKNVRKRSVSPLPLPLPFPHMFYFNATWTSSIYQRRPKLPRPMPLPWPSQYHREDIGDIISLPGKSSCMLLGDTYIWGRRTPMPPLQ